MDLAAAPEAVTEEAEVLDVAGAAELLKMSRHWVYKASADGRLPTVKIGRRTRFRRTALLAWLESQTSGGEAH